MVIRFKGIYFKSLDFEVNRNENYLEMFFGGILTFVVSGVDLLFELGICLLANYIGFGSLRFCFLNNKWVNFNVREWFPFDEPINLSATIFID